MSSEMRQPPLPMPFDNGVTPHQSWSEWTLLIFRILFGLTESGTTAQRPTKNLWIGRTYFDSTLGYQICVKTISPVVWVNGTGTTV